MPEDLGRNFLDAFFKTKELRQQNIYKQTLSQQFAQEMQLRQQELQQRIAEHGAQQKYWQDIIQNRDSQQAEAKRKEDAAEQFNAAKGVASGEMKPVVPPGQQIPQLIGSTPGPGGVPVLQTPGPNTSPSFSYGGGQYQFSSPEELMARKNAEKVAEQAGLAQEGAERFKAFQDQASKTLGTAYKPSPEQNAAVFGFFGAGGGTPGTEMAKLLLGTKTAGGGALGGKITSDELGAFNIMNADPATQHVYQTIRDNPKAFEDPAFVATATPLLATAQKKVEHLKAIGAATTQGAITSRDAAKDTEFKNLSAEMGPSNLYGDVKSFNSRLSGLLQSGKYGADSIDKYVNIQSKADKRVKPTLLEQLGLASEGAPQGAPSTTEVR